MTAERPGLTPAGRDSADRVRELTRGVPSLERRLWRLVGSAFLIGCAFGLVLGVALTVGAAYVLAATR